MTMKVTKKLIDELARQDRAVEALENQLKQAKAKLAELLTPVLEHAETIASGPADKVVLQGMSSIVELSAKRSTRVITDVARAYHMLEDVEAGLGLANISIPLKALDDNLRKVEVQGLCEVRYGNRSLKVLSGGN
jgi:hypothetical protein